MAKRRTKKEIALETEAQAQVEVQVEATEMKEVLSETVEQEVAAEAPKSTWDKAVERFNSWNTKK